MPMRRNGNPKSGTCLLYTSILFGDNVTKCNVITGELRNVSPELSRQGPFRRTWTLPLVFSEADPHALYFSDQFLFKTLDGGDSWAQISPDLTREDPGVPSNLDEATAADAPPGKRRGVIYTIAVSYTHLDVYKRQMSSRTQKPRPCVATIKSSP